MDKFNERFVQISDMQAVDLLKCHSITKTNSIDIEIGIYLAFTNEIILWEFNTVEERDVVFSQLIIR